MKEREIRLFCEGAGVKFVSVSSDGKHHKVIVELAPGVTRWVAFPKTPSDHRALLNQKALLRRMKREYSPK